MKFIISGGGICGLTTAIALHQKGFDVTIYEAAKEIKAVGAGLNLSSNAVRALGAIGLDKAIIAKSKAQTGGQFLTPKGKILNHTDLQPLVEKFGVPALISIHRADLHQILLDAIKDKVPFYTNKRGERISKNEKGVELHFSDGTSVKGDYLLACDGIHSVIRKQFLPKVSTQYAGYTIWRGLVYHQPGEINLEYPFKTWGKNGQFGAVPMSNNRMYWYASFKAKAKDPNLRALKISDLTKRFKDYHTPIPQLLALTEESDVLLNDAEELPNLPNFAFDRILLMGDAAHAMTPNLGQGACQSIEDAVVLAKLLAAESTPEKAFKTFEKQRIPRTQKAAFDSRNVGKAAHLDNSLLIALRNFYLRQTSKSAFNKQVDFLNAIEF